MWPPSHAGSGLGMIPNPELLAGLVDETTGDIMEDESSGENLTKTAVTVRTNPLIPTGQGLPALPKKLVDRILSNEYIDFSELPPAKGKVRPLHQSFEGQVILVQAEDLLQSRKLIPDLPTWVQCFAIYVTVLAQKQPARIPELMAYAATIATASKKYRWPAWVVYDQNFRQEASCNPSQSWAKIDPSIYSQCFLGMAKSAEGWCHTCQSLDHTSDNCPAGSSASTTHKRPWQIVTRQQGDPSLKPICLKYNRNDGECPFGPRCRYLHCCSRCKGSHPVKRCPLAASGSKEKSMKL